MQHTLIRFQVLCVFFCFLNLGDGNYTTVSPDATCLHVDPASTKTEHCSRKCCLKILEAWACDTADQLPELDRRSRNYVANGIDENDPRVDDFILNDGWYTVATAIGTYQMPDKVPDNGVCGTLNPIYLSGTHPLIDDLSETPTDITACLKDEFEDCATTYMIQIRRCGDVIQYYLVTTDQHSAYCFDPPDLQGVEDISTAPENVNLGNIKVIPEIKHTDRDDGNKVIYEPYLEFNCAFSIQDTYFYAVSWYYNGQLITTYGPTHDLKTLVLKEETLLDIGAVMGFNLICGVRVYKDVLGMNTEMESSEEFFAGLKIPTPQITIDKSKSTDVEIIQTVPIGCRYTSKSEDDPCEHRLAMIDPRKYTCLEGNLIFPSATPRCGFDMGALKGGEIWNPDGIKHTFTITTKDENYEDRNFYKLHLQTHNKGHVMWRNYQPAEIQVHVTNSNAIRNKVCYSHIDPHMRTGDGSYYENQREGDYMLYRNKEYDIEVQERLVRCYGVAWCACAVGVRAGGDIFMIHLCTVKFAEFKTCKDGRTITVVKKSSIHYEIITPIGTRIDAKLLGGNTLLNIDITMAPKDMGNMEGLCGNVDGDKTNDFKKRDGTIADSQTFAKDWRLRDDENVFKKGDFPSWSETNNYFCVCEQAFDESIEPAPTTESVCAPSMDLVCKRKNADRKNKVCIKMKRKRSLANKIGREIDRKLNVEIPIPEVKITKRQTISDTDAFNYCTEKINGSLAFTKYANETAGENPESVIAQCKFDVLAADDYSYAGEHVDSLNSIVAKKFELTPGYVANHTELVTEFKENSCPKNCSERGHCTTERECECDTFFHGPECGIDERIALVIVDTEGGGVCDLQDGDGCGCLSFSTDNLLDNFTCQVSGEIVYDNNITDTITTSKQAGQLEDIFTGACCVSELRKRRSTTNSTVFAARYDIAISNNGVNFGNTRSVVVLDSACQTSSQDKDGMPLVELKPDTCFIDGQCMASQDVNYHDDCYICDPDVNQRNWTNNLLETAMHRSLLQRESIQSKTKPVSTSPYFYLINRNKGALFEIRIAIQ